MTCKTVRPPLNFPADATGVGLGRVPNESKTCPFLFVCDVGREHVMPVFQTRMHVVYEEIWTVEATDADEASQKFAKLTDDVDTGDMSGEVVDWERVGKVTEDE